MTYEPKHYVLRVNTTHVNRAAELYTPFVSFDLYHSQLVPDLATVTVRSRAQEESLLELLATQPLITYRQAVSRAAQEDTHD